MESTRVRLNTHARVIHVVSAVYSLVSVVVQEQKEDNLEVAHVGRPRTIQNPLMEIAARTLTHPVLRLLLMKKNRACKRELTSSAIIPAVWGCF